MLAKKDPRLNVADMYVFAGKPGNTVMAMTANADAGISAPDTLHAEAQYAFHFHRTHDDQEALIFKVRFGKPYHVDGGESGHVQPYRVIRAGPGEFEGSDGEVVLQGESGKVCENAGIRAFVGRAPELWAADAFAFRAFMSALHEKNHFDLSVWKNKANFFANRNVSAIVLEVPDSLIGGGRVTVWSNISLFGHAPDLQVSRWGLPLFSHLFLENPFDDKVEEYHQKRPAQDRACFGPTIERLVSRLTALAGSAANPDAYGKEVASRICPSMLPYEIGSEASFTLAAFNGRPLADDVLDVMFSLAANTPIADGVSPDKTKIIDEFPYYGPPYNEEEQRGLVGIPQHADAAY